MACKGNFRMFTIKQHNNTGLSDHEFFQSLNLDDESSFELIYKRYWSRLYIYAFNVLQEREICEDIVQEIFVNLWTKRHNLQILDLNSYLYQAVKHQIFNCFRKSKYKKQLLMKFNLMNEQYEIEELYEIDELKNEIKSIVTKLPGKRGKIFRMSRDEGLSNKEISEKLNISLQTVKNQISESLKIIRKSLKKIYILFF